MYISHSISKAKVRGREIFTILNCMSVVFAQFLTECASFGRPHLPTQNMVYGLAKLGHELQSVDNDDERFSA